MAVLERGPGFTKRRHRSRGGAGRTTAARRSPRATAAGAAFLALALASTPGPAQEPSLPQVLARATEYVEELHARLSGVVMEERYRQRASWPAGFGRLGGDSYERVTLRSDYLLVRPEGSERYFGFRDVFEANGSRVRDRDERLAQLFLGGASTLDGQVRGILTDSARYNVGDVQRNTNTPTLALLFLRQSHKLRFAFERVRDRSPSLGVDAPDGGVWVVEYRETWPTTVIRRRRGGNLPARGRYWIEPATGRVLVTELALDDDEVDSLVTVRYARPEELDHLVPVEMRERYRNRGSGSRVEGTATYSRFRRFQVLVEESAPFRD